MIQEVNTMQFNRYTKHAVLSMLLVIAMLLGMTACGGGYKNPDDQFRKMENAWLSENIGDVLSVYEDARGQLAEPNQKVEGTLKLTVGDPLINLIRSQFPYDLSLLQDITFDVSTSVKDTKTMISAALKLAGTKLASIGVYADTKTGVSAISLGDLADGWLKIDPASMGMADEEVANMAAVIFEAADSLPKQKVLSSIINRYYGILLDSITGIAKADGTLTADGVSVECTTLTANVTQRMLYEGTKKVMRTLIESLSESLGFSLKDAYDGFIEQTRSSLEDMESEDSASAVTDDVLFTVVDYVSGDEIIGRQLVAEGDEEILFYGKASTKEGFGFELRANIDYTTVTIKGEGTEKKGAVTGDFDVIVDGSALAFVKLDKFNTEDFLDGTPNGTVTIAPGAGFWNIFSDSSDSAVTGILGSAFSLRAIFDCSDDEANISVDLLNGSDVYVGIAVKSSIKKADKISEPKATEDMEAWSSTIDIAKLISNIEDTKYASDINEILQGTLGMTLEDIETLLAGGGF